MDEELVDESGLVLDAFRGHFDKNVKAFTKPMEKLCWLLLDRGITPNSEPLDVFINKVFKDCYPCLFKEWSLCAPLYPKSGHLFAPS